MKFIHLSDLHIGKNVNDHSMIGEQKYILNQILEGIKKEKPDAVLISGDVYDKTTPPLEAVLLLDDFLNKLDEIEGLTVILISGNHDSAERLSFGAKRMKKSGLYIKSIFDGDLTPVTLEDEYGKVNFYSVPFIRRADVNNVYNTDIRDYTEAFSFVVEKMELDTSERNVILSHQLVTGASFSESETAVGGIEDIKAEAYAAFDYAALGHIHKPQNIGSRLRYCGTPLKYNVSEVGYQKTYTVVELYGKKSEQELCDINVREVPLIPEHDMVKIEGYFDEIMRARTDENGIVTSDYVYVVLRDDDYVNDAAVKLRKLYPNFMNASYSGKGQTTAFDFDMTIEKAEKQTPFNIFSEFYKKMHMENDPDEVQTEILKAAIKEVWGEDEI